MIGEWCDKVVVRACSAYTLSLLGSPERGEHEDRKLGGRSQSPADSNPVEAGQHDIEDHQVWGPVARAAQGIVAIACDRDFVTLRREDALQGRGQPGVVLDDEDQRASHLNGIYKTRVRISYELEETGLA